MHLIIQCNQPFPCLQGSQGNRQLYLPVGGGELQLFFPKRLIVGLPKILHALVTFLRVAREISGLYYKTITIIIMTIISDATIWSVTFDDAS